MATLSLGAAAEQLKRLSPRAPVSVTTTSGVRIHAVQTGSLILKAAHRRYAGPNALALPAILLDPRWTEPLPMLSWVIEHPEGLLLIDTGERAAASAPETYLACDRELAWFVTRNFRLLVRPEEELVAQLHALGLDPAAVRWVVQTHLHFDHVGGLAAFPQAQVLVSAPEIAQPPRGAAPCLWPAWFQPTAVTYAHTAAGPFPERWTLTQVGDVHVIPTAGHTRGHQSVLLDDGDGETVWCFAGDAAFSEAQIWRGEIAGIVQDRKLAALSGLQLRRLMSERPTICLPTHDPETLRRFATRQIARQPARVRP